MTSLTPEQRRRSQSGVILYVLAGAANHALAQALGPLFLLSLGAAPLHLGLLAAVGQLDKLSRLAGVELLARGVGKARLMFWGRLLTVPAASLLVVSALSGTDLPGALWIAIAVMAIRASLQQMGNAAWWPLVQDVTAGASFGQFLTRMRVQQRLLELALPLGVGVWLGQSPTPQRFAPIFALAALTFIVGAVSIRRVHELPSTTAPGGLGTRLRQTIAVPAVSRCAQFMALRGLLLSASFPFWVVSLTDRGLPASQFVWMGSILAGGQIASLWFWGRVIDRHGYRPALVPCLIGVCCLSGAWGVLPDSDGGLLVWSAIVFLLWGVLEAGIQMGQSRAMVDAAPDDLRAEGFVVLMLASALGGGLGGLLGGLLFSVAGTRWGASGDLMYLAIVQLAFVLPLLRARRL